MILKIRHENSTVEESIELFSPSIVDCTYIAPDNVEILSVIWPDGTEFDYIADIVLPHVSRGGSAHVLKKMLLIRSDKRISIFKAHPDASKELANIRAESIKAVS